MAHLSVALLHQPRIRVMLALLWTLGIFVATLMPAGEVPEVNVSHIDKVVHFAMFFGFGGLWMWALPQPLGRRISWVLAAGVVGALSTEGFQWLMDLGRTADLGDIVANLLGLCCGIGVAAFLYPYYPSRPRR